MTISPHPSDARTAGRTTAEMIFAAVVFAALAFVVYIFLRPGSSPPTAPVEAKRIYKTLTTADGMIPLKAVIVPRDGAILFSAPDAATATDRRLPMFESYFPLHRRGEFLDLSNDPTSEKSIGWVKASSALIWPTREALRPNKSNVDRKPLRLWRRREDVGNSALVAYDEDPEADPAKPYPVIDDAVGSYEIALTWQSADFANIGVDTAWTGRLDIPDDARFYYLTTREELKRRYEEMNAALLDLTGGKNSRNPLIQLLKSNINIATGDKIDSGDEDVGLLRRILRDLRNPLKIAAMQPSEVRRDSANMRRKLERLRRFYQNRDNWNERGIGWLPAEDLPGN